MSLCTWATVVSTVPSRSLHGIEPRQIFGDSGEPVPLPTFLSFLELLEELNRGETENSAVKETKLFCQESFNSSSLSSPSSSSDIDLDKFLDLEGLNEEDIFEASSTETAINSHCSTSDWTSHHSSFSSASEYFCCPDYFLPSPEILPYEDVCKYEDFSDWSPELFEEKIELKNPFKDPGETSSTNAECKSVHEFTGETPSEYETTCQCRGEASFQKAERKTRCKFPRGIALNAAERKKSTATSAHSGKARTSIFTALNGPQESVKHNHRNKRKRKCTNCFEPQESRSQCKSFGATWRQVKLREGI